MWHDELMPEWNTIAHRLANVIGILSGLALVPFWFQAFFTLGANDNLFSVVLVLAFASVLPLHIVAIWRPRPVAKILLMFSAAYLLWVLFESLRTLRLSVVPDLNWPIIGFFLCPCAMTSALLFVPKKYGQAQGR